MDEIITALESLNDDQVAKIVKLIKKLAGKNSTPKQSPQPKQDYHKIKNSAPPKSRKVQNRAPVSRLERPEPTRGPRRGLDDNGNRGKRGKHARTLPFEIYDRPNRFVDDVKVLGMPHQQAERADAAIDKKLAKYAPVARRPPIQLATVVCAGCGYEFDVNPDLIPESGIYKCNDCITR